MKKTILSLCLGLFFTGLSVAQKVDPKHTNFYFTQTVDNNDYSIEIIDVVSKLEFCKMKLKITNKSNDYLMFKYGDVELTNASGSYKPKKALDFSTHKGNEIIEPKEKASIVLTFDGVNMHQDEFKLILKGLSKFSAKGTEFEANDFNLPANTNEVDAGPFKVSLKALDKKTDLTIVRFNAEYKGDDKHIGIIEANKIVCKTSKGQEWARTNRRDKTVILLDGENDKFNLYYEIDKGASGIDMQFDNMALVFKDAFREAAIVSIPAQTLAFKVDPGMTAGKNR
ncbi:MAG: hypothetical protein K1X82_01255 [Bacteroidia bacterium]|nr:hypothetical protein [Bacteroidia bacterium]